MQRRITDDNCLLDTALAGDIGDGARCPQPWNDAGQQLVRQNRSPVQMRSPGIAGVLRRDRDARSARRRPQGQVRQNAA